MKAIIYNPVTHINTDDVTYLIQNDILGPNFKDDFDEIYKGNTNRINDPIKIDDLITTLDNLKTLGANYVSIEYHVDHREYEIDGQEVRLATQEEIDNYNQYKKNEDIRCLKNMITEKKLNLIYFNKNLKISPENNQFQMLFSFNNES